MAPDRTCSELSVLLVDDDEDEFVLLRQLLDEVAETKYRLDWVATYREGLESILRQDHDVYLVDHRLGAGTGLALIEEVVQRGCRAPMVLVTGQGDRETDIMAMKAGAADYLVKGRYDMDLLERTLRHALDRAAASERLRLDMMGADPFESVTVPPDVEAEIYRVLERGHVDLEFQPIFDLARWVIDERHAVGFEALARFRQLSPGVAFRNAHQLGLGEDLELVAIRSALNHLGELPRSAYLTVNITPLMVFHPGFAALLQDVPLDRLMIEVPERTSAQASPSIDHALDRLRFLGVRVAIDDVGASLASLARLARLDHDVLKLDVDLVQNIETDSTRQAIARGLCAFAEAFGVTVIAEGIETRDAFMTLADIGVPYGQGYWLARPGPVSQWTVPSKRQPSITA